MVDLDAFGVRRPGIGAHAAAPLHHARPQWYRAAPGHEIGRGPPVLFCEVGTVDIGSRGWPLGAQQDEILSRACPTLHPPHHYSFTPAHAVRQLPLVSLLSRWCGQSTAQ